MRTTTEWQALLAGTTPGPWEWHGGPDPDMRFIYADEGGMCMTVEPVGSSYRDADPVLAAHAPAAVAEVVRLRKAIAAVRDDYRRSAEVDSLLAQFSTVPLIPLFDDLADTLTRILEGDNHEQ